MSKTFLHHLVSMVKEDGLEMPLPAFRHAERNFLLGFLKIRLSVQIRRLACICQTTTKSSGTCTIMIPKSAALQIARLARTVGDRKEPMLLLNSTLWLTVLIANVNLIINK